jgi:hypothetical protein
MRPGLFILEQRSDHLDMALAAAKEFAAEEREGGILWMIAGQGVEPLLGKSMNDAPKTAPINRTHTSRRAWYWYRGSTAPAIPSEKRLRRREPPLAPNAGSRLRLAPCGFRKPQGCGHHRSRSPLQKDGSRWRATAWQEQSLAADISRPGSRSWARHKGANHDLLRV